MRVDCNGRATAIALDPGFSELVLEVEADAAGILQIAITSMPWKPSAVLQSSDPRQLGCLIYEILLDSERPIPRRATVIMPTFNRCDILLVNLEALARQTWPEFDVVVVNDGSTDGTTEALAEWQAQNANRLQLQILHQENGGPARAHNHGVRNATGDILIFIGDDTRPDGNFIELHMRKQAELEGPCAVIGQTIWDAAQVHVTPFLRFIGERGPQFGFALLRDGHECPFTTFYGSNLSIARELLGPEPFSPAFKRAGWEDIELGFRLHRRGLRIIYHAAAILRHNHVYTLTNFLRRQEHVGKSSHVIFRLHPELLHNPLIAPSEAPARVPWRWLAADALVPLWQALDEGDVELPEELYCALLDKAFLRGRSAPGVD